ncbi:hypothetical protein Hanom_Chr01g00085361 [Helianthus anomalus]
MITCRGDCRHDMMHLQMHRIIQSRSKTIYLDFLNSPTGRTDLTSHHSWFN